MSQNSLLILDLQSIKDSIRDLDSHCSIPEIRQAAISVIKPKLDAFTSDAHFFFNVSKLNLRDISKSMNVDMDGPTLSQSEPYFRHLCLKKNEKTNQYRYQRPTTPFKILLVISSEEWERYETAVEDVEQLISKQLKSKVFNLYLYWKIIFLMFLQ